MYRTSVEEQGVKKLVNQTRLKSYICKNHSHKHKNGMMEESVYLFSRNARELCCNML